MQADTHTSYMCIYVYIQRHGYLYVYMDLEYLSRIKENNLRTRKFKNFIKANG